MLQRFLRSFFISLSKAKWAQDAVSHWGLAWRAASRYVAGNRLDDAIAVIRELNARGINTSLDHLGENTTRPEEASQAADEVILALRAIADSGVRSNVSVKLSQIGLTLDETLCRQNLARILAEAQRLGCFIRIDMEDSSLTNATLAAYTWAREQGFENMGVVIQAYLYRSEADLCKIAEKNGRVRLCKGAYDEPAQVAYPQKKDVDTSYDHLAALLLDESQKAGYPLLSPDGRIPPIPAIATHDEARIQFVENEVQRRSVPKDALEFQMLYGIRRDLQDKLVGLGYPVRVYVPYGSHWYPYFMRRLAERPANVWFFLSNFFRR